MIIWNQSQSVWQFFTRPGFLCPGVLRLHGPWGQGSADMRPPLTHFVILFSCSGLRRLNDGSSAGLPEERALYLDINLPLRDRHACLARTKLLSPEPLEAAKAGARVMTCEIHRCTQVRRHRAPFGVGECLPLIHQRASPGGILGFWVCRPQFGENECGTSKTSSRTWLKLRFRIPNCLVKPATVDLRFQTSARRRAARWQMPNAPPPPSSDQDVRLKDEQIIQRSEGDPSLFSPCGGSLAGRHVSSDSVALRSLLLLLWLPLLLAACQSFTALNYCWNWKICHLSLVSLF